MSEPQPTLAGMLAALGQAAGPAPVEPTGEMRTAAAATRQMFVAFVQAGFSSVEALELTKQILATGAQR